MDCRFRVISGPRFWREIFPVLERMRPGAQILRHLACPRAARSIDCVRARDAFHRPPCSTNLDSASITFGGILESRRKVRLSVRSIRARYGLSKAARSRHPVLSKTKKEKFRWTMPIAFLPSRATSMLAIRTRAPAKVDILFSVGVRSIR